MHECVIVLFLLAGKHMVGADYSIDQILMQALPKDQMFNTFQMSPEGDAMLTLEMDIRMDLRQYIRFKNMARVGRQKRKAISVLSYRWDNCKVYYEFMEGHFDEMEQSVILEAMEEWKTYTCLDFIPARDQKDKIVFQTGQGGCYSRLGKVGGAQEIALGRNCVQKMVVVHEIGHAIGWIHEQSRPDRDEFVRINFGRIPRPLHAQFDVFPAHLINDHDVAYDYRSVMHYSGNAVVERSIETLDPKYQSIIGMAKGLSFRDVMLANLMYNCSSMLCPGTSPDCRTHGTDAFLFKLNGRCRCVCPGSDADLLVPCDSALSTTTTTTSTTSTSTTTTTTTTTTPTTTTEAGPMECVDLMPDCAQLVEAGECKMNMAHMDIYCKKSCNFCGEHDVCMDMDPSCPMLALGQLCSNPAFEELTSVLCRKSCRLCTPVDPCKLQQMMGLVADQTNSGHRHSAIGTTVSALVLVLLWTLY